MSKQLIKTKERKKEKNNQKRYLRKEGCFMMKNVNTTVIYNNYKCICT